MSVLGNVDVRARVWAAMGGVLPPAIAWVDGAPIQGVAFVSADALDEYTITFISPAGDVRPQSLLETGGRTYRVNEVTGTDDAFSLTCELVSALEPRDEMTIDVAVRNPYVVVTRTEPGAAEIVGRFSHDNGPWRTIRGTGRTIRARYTGMGVMQGEVWRELPDGTRNESQALAVTT